MWNLQYPLILTLNLNLIQQGPMQNCNKYTRDNSYSQLICVIVSWRKMIATIVDDSDGADETISLKH